MKIYKKAILPLGFEANGLSCGIKKSGKPDLALFISQLPAKAACLFTTNKIQAAPVYFNKEALRTNHRFKAILVNSGNANCLTGKAGLSDARDIVKELTSGLGIKKEEMLISSTGIIGRRLPVAKIKKAIPSLIQGLSKPGIDKAKKAIMTTDKFVKEISIKFDLGSHTVTLCGIAKGAGMIAPNLATMLAFIFTDARISQGALKQALKAAVDDSFNCITVDGCMSTNDTVMLLANGAAGNNQIEKDKDLGVFLKALKIVCLELAKMIVLDAEGASKFIQIRVSEAKSFSEARQIALSIANSDLFKTAAYGENPNFGRIYAAAGASGIEIKEERLKVEVSPLNKKYIEVGVAVARGKASATVYTCDLTPEYIKINAAYN